MGLSGLSSHLLACMMGALNQVKWIIFSFVDRDNAASLF